VSDAESTSVSDSRVAPAIDWMRANVAGASGAMRHALIAGGRSNLTYRVTAADGRTWVLRRPPTGTLLPRAHDMRREFRIIQALAERTAIPVPPPVAMCDDTEVLGVPFYVMSDVTGAVLREPADSAALEGEARARAARHAIDVLVDLHAVDVDGAGLGDLGRRDSYVERQLRRWLSQVEQSGDVEIAALLSRQQERLLRAVPPDAGTALVHGDYRFDNLIVDPDEGVVKAVLDWEIATLGDPFADLASFLVYWDEVGDERGALGVLGPTAVAGFPSRAEVATTYAAASGRDLDRLDFYLAFGYWKVACILQGVAHRYRAGDGGGAAAPADDISEHLRWLVCRSVEHLG
jgi:aminoglycoside phosphotransferase (APT) family kinase protein